MDLRLRASESKQPLGPSEKKSSVEQLEMCVWTQQRG